MQNESNESNEQQSHIVENGHNHRVHRRNRNMVLLIMIGALLILGSNKISALGNIKFFGKEKDISFGLQEKKEYTKTFVLSNKENTTLNLKGMNGSIVVKGENSENEVELKVEYILKNFMGVSDEDHNIEAVNENDQIELQYNPRAFKSVMIEASIPEEYIKQIIAKTSNGKVEVEQVNSEHVSLISSNGQIVLTNSEANEIDMSTSNAEIELEEVLSKFIEGDTSNGPIKITDVDSSSLEVSTSNGNIEYKADEEYLQGYKEYDVKLTTSNGKINLDLPQESSIGYYFDGSTSNGTIATEEMTLVTKELSKNKINAKTEKYDQANTKVNIDFQTSNGSININ